MATQVIMPQLGESVVEGKVSRWLKHVGDAVKQYDPILEVETDKVTTEVTAIASGALLAILVEEGVTVKAGTPLAVIGQPGEPVESGALSVAPERETLNVERETSARISPVVAKIAAEYGVDVSQVAGTGAGGRVTKKDILEYVERTPRLLGEGAGVREELPPWERPGSGDLFKPTEEIIAPAAERRPPIPTTQYPTLPGDELLPHTSMRRSIAEHMVRSRRTSPHVTTIFEVDMSRVITHREAHKAAFERDGARLTFTAYFVAVAAAALKEHPFVNSTFTDEGLVVHKQINIGIAVSLGAEGLIVPVLKGADQLSLLGIARAVNDVADRARTRKLTPDDVVGSTFTITNHGTAGSLFATPIINQPNVGILGVGVLQKRPVVVTQDGVDMIAIKPMLYMGLTFDHRILDGGSADVFMAKVKELLENWQPV